MTKKPKEPEDLGIKIGSKKEAFLTKVKSALEEEEENCRFTAELNRGILKLVNSWIDQEKEKFK